MTNDEPRYADLFTLLAAGAARPTVPAVLAACAPGRPERHVTTSPRRNDLARLLKSVMTGGRALGGPP